MKRKISEKASIEIVEGDLTQLDVDAIVNAANTQLWLGAGVAGAIRTRGGPTIQKECNDIISKYPTQSIPLGEAAITSGGNLKARWVIHAASMGSGTLTTEKSLRDATRNALLRAEEKKLKSIAFPAIGTGVAGFRLNKCAEIMQKVIVDHLLCAQNSSLERVILALFDSKATLEFEKVLFQI
ncbi:MAG: macro domain-containing protein [Candidatus Thorarchaeota archaeon]